jgi:hypothetical protein
MTAIFLLELALYSITIFLIYPFKVVTSSLASAAAAASL